MPFDSGKVLRYVVFFAHHGRMTDNGGRAGRGWVIGGAFAGQAGIFIGIGALLAGAASAPVMSVSAMPVPAAAPLPVISAQAIPVPVIPQPPNMFSYTVSMYGSASGGTVSAVYPERRSPLPAYTVKPGQRAGIILSVAIPRTLKLTGLTLTFTQVVPDIVLPMDQSLYRADTQVPLAPGPHNFVVGWPGSGSALQPGTQWLIYLSADSPDVSDGSPIATVTVTS
jgi:hypothetical protein